MASLGLPEMVKVSMGAINTWSVLAKFCSTLTIVDCALGTKSVIYNRAIRAAVGEISTDSAFPSCPSATAQLLVNFIAEYSDTAGRFRLTL